MSLIEFGDCRETMRRWASEGRRARTCVTSPPYWGLRSYVPPGSMRLRSDLTPEQVAYVLAEMQKAGVTRDIP